jgi:hypothetical protein
MGGGGRKAEDQFAFAQRRRDAEGGVGLAPATALKPRRARRTTKLVGRYRPSSCSLKSKATADERRCRQSRMGFRPCGLFSAERRKRDSRKKRKKAKSSRVGARAIGTRAASVLRTRRGASRRTRARPLCRSEVEVLAAICGNTPRAPCLRLPAAGRGLIGTTIPAAPNAVHRGSRGLLFIANAGEPTTVQPAYLTWIGLLGAACRVGCPLVIAEGTRICRFALSSPMIIRLFGKH